MLILSRHKDETIIIGDNEIRITVCEFRGGNGREKVRIGIDCPKSISCHREEVYNEIKKEDGTILGLNNIVPPIDHEEQQKQEERDRER